jgi:hypothetical protein
MDFSCEQRVQAGAFASLLAGERSEQRYGRLRYVGINVSRIGHLFRDDLVLDHVFAIGVSVEGQSAAEHFVEHHAGGINVAAGIDILFRQHCSGLM